MSKTKLILVIIISIAITITAITFTTYKIHIKKNADRNTKNKIEQESKLSQQSWQTQLLRDTFNHRYEFSADKLPDSEYLTFSGFDRESINNYTAYLEEFNNLPVDISSLQQQYTHIAISKTPIIKTNKLERIHDSNHPSQENISSIVERIKSSLRYQYSEEDLGYTFSPELQKTNNYKGIFDQRFNLKHNNTTVLNLATSIEGTLENDDTLKNATYDSNVGSELSEEKSSITIPQKLTFDEFLKQLKDGKGRIYRIENLSQNIEYSLTIQNGLADIQSDTKINAKSLEVEYFYQWEDSTLVPLLRISGSLPTKYGEQEISFWIWFTK